MENNAQPRWSSQTKIIVALLILAVLIFLGYRFQTVLAPIILSIILAFVLVPLVNRIQQRLKFARGLAILPVYLLLMAILGLTLWLVIPLILRELKGFTVDLQQMVAQTKIFFEGEISIGGLIINGPDIYAQIISSIQGIATVLVGKTITAITKVAELVIWFVFILIVSFYFIKDNQAIIRWLEDLAPADYRPDVARIRSELNIIWSAFFRSQLLLSLLVAVIISTIGLLIGMPFALLMGIIAGLLEFMPSLGHAIWLILASSMALFLGSTWMPIPNWAFLLIVLACHIIFTQFDLNYLIPRLIGRSVKLPPVVVILGIVAGAALAGVMGVVLAAPTIASMRVLGRYIYARLADQDPFPEQHAYKTLPPPEPRIWKKVPQVQVKRGRQKPPDQTSP